MRTLLIVLALIPCLAHASVTPSPPPFAKQVIWDTQANSGNGGWVSAQMFDSYSSNALNCAVQGSVTPGFDLENFSHAAVGVALSSGFINNANFSVERSFDGVSYTSYPSSENVTGSGYIENITAIARWIRIKVSTAQGGPGPCSANITVNAKR